MARRSSSAARVRAGPPLGPVMAVSAALFLASLIAPAAVTGGAPYPSPPRPDAEVTRYVTEHGDVLGLTGLFQFASSVPLAVFGAAAAAQLRRVGVRAAGPIIGAVGSVLASAALAVSGMLQWTLARVEPDAPLSLFVALRDLGFVAGGPWHVAGLGLLVAGIAVPALFYRLLPRWLAVVGVAIAVICEVATFVMLFDWLAYAIPLGRFPALAWLVAAAFLLPATRRRPTH